METRRERIGNVVTISLVTVLIWIWAAGETREDITSFTDLRLIGQTSGSVQIEPSEINSISFQMRGARRAIDAMAARFREPLEIQIGTLGVPADPGVHEIDLLAVGQLLAEQEDLPVTFLSAEPKTTSVTIKSLETRSMAIQVLLPEGVRTAGAVEVAPTEASITLPSSLTTLPNLSIAATVSDEDLASLTPGRLQEIEATLGLPSSLAAYEDDVTITPRKVLVRLKLVSADSTLLVPSIPVQIAGPPTDLDQYLVTVDPAAAFLRDVTLRGPAEAITSIAEGRMSVIAFLHLTSDELAQGITEKAVSMWQLPTGVTVSSIGDDSTSNPMVPLTIEDRTRQP